MTGAIEAVAAKALEIVIKREVQHFMKRRSDDATRIVIEEMRTAKVDPEQVARREDVAGMLVTFYLAMAQGAAFHNLRIIAKVLASKAADDKSRSDDFMMWTDTIASLLPEEAILLATLHRHTIEEAKGELDSVKIQSEAMRLTRAELIGGVKLIKSEDDFQAICSALARTGFILIRSAFGNIAFAASSRLAALAKMADLQAWADEAQS